MKTQKVLLRGRGQETGGGRVGQIVAKTAVKKAMLRCEGGGDAPVSRPWTALHWTPGSTTLHYQPTFVSRCYLLPPPPLSHAADLQICPAHLHVSTLCYLCLVSVLFVCSLLCGLGLFWWFTMIFCGFVFIVKLELAAILPWWLFYNSQSMSRMLKIIVITGFISMINIFLEQLVKIRFLIYKTV